MQDDAVQKPDGAQNIPQSREESPSKVTFSSLSKSRGPISLKPQSTSSTPYRDQIEERLASENPESNKTPPLKKESATAIAPEDLDRYIYLRLPKKYGHAIRQHALERNEKVTETISNLIKDYLQKNNIQLK